MLFNILFTWASFVGQPLIPLGLFAYYYETCTFIHMQFPIDEQLETAKGEERRLKFDKVNDILKV